MVSVHDLPRTGVFTQLLSAVDVTDFLHRLVLSTQVVVKRLSRAITVRYDANSITVAASDERAGRLDETRDRNQTGPCLPCEDSGKVVSSPDCRTEQRWPACTAAAVREGLRCSLSFPLAAGGETFGALNVYGLEKPHLFGVTERRQLLLFAARCRSRGGRK
jgi:GAF domain-containing protein